SGLGTRDSGHPKGCPLRKPRGYGAPAAQGKRHDAQDEDEPQSARYQSVAEAPRSKAKCDPMRAALDDGTQKITVHADRLSRVGTNDLCATPSDIIGESPSRIESFCERQQTPPACGGLDDDPAGQIFENSD